MLKQNASCAFLFLYRKLLVSYKVKNAPRGCASRGEEVSCKQHRSSAKESQATLCSLCNVASRRRALTVLALLKCFLREMDAVKNGIAVFVYKIFFRFHAKIFCSTQ